MQKRWLVKSKPEATIVDSLSASLNIDHKLASLLAQRGVTTFEEAKHFFRPEYSDLHNPFLMKDMDKAVARLEQAIAKGENILVYGDYDVDGTTAVAFFYSFLSAFYAKTDYYIPDRYKEGYGISFAGIDFAEANNFSLTIALDCGIRSNDKVAYAREKGIDFIICDHHLPGEKCPDAAAVLDPKQADCSYPYKELSGCGIGFKLAQAYALNNNIAFTELEKYIDLVAVSIAADIVPITGENRVLSYYGLKKLNENPSSGLRSIMELNNIKRELGISDIVFIIAPRINAAGRIASGRQAVELLIASGRENTNAKAFEINNLNIERSDLDKNITAHALDMIDKSVVLQKRKSTVLFHETWSKGVVGIVASRLIEKYYRPTIVLAVEDGYATGSARSVRDYNVYQAIEACSDLLEQFGGHKYAAGLKIKIENVEAFAEKFERVVSETITEDMLTPCIEVDDELKLDNINEKFLRILKQFAPFGPGNMNPVFITKNLSCKGFPKVMKEKHLKLEVFDSDNPLRTVEAVAFNMAEYFETLCSKIPFTICYTIEENNWNVRTSIQLNVKDIRF
ncbi:MAG: Single-stranded-DNA-specific exonuclease RecJ [Bacteroidia bacterium]|nr:Single-stranded-DNA-specific exonuclease RecJ [Bacteroidia bacterium]